MNNQENQAVEIDVFAMLKTLWKRKFSIVLVAFFVFLPLQRLATVPFQPRKNTKVLAGSTVSRQNQDNNALTNSDLQAGSLLGYDYREIIFSKCLEPGHRRIETRYDTC